MPRPAHAAGLPASIVNSVCGELPHDHEAAVSTIMPSSMLACQMPIDVGVAARAILPETVRFIM